MHFGSPYYLLLFLPWSLAIWFVYRRRVKQALLFAPFHRIPAQRTSWRMLLRPLAPILFLAGLAMIIVALARPQTVFSRTVRRSDAIGIQMVVDCSGSMQALDFSTPDKQRTRLDVVKETFAAFVAKRPADLIGLITFGGFASSRVPLTLDHGALLHTLKGVDTARNIFSPDGTLMNQEEMLTAIGDALATGCARFENSSLKSRILVLLSDGESNTGIIKPDDAAKAAKALGVKVYTIGVGSNTRAPFAARDTFGRQVIQYGNVRLDEELLRKIASSTDAQYFNVKDAQGLKNVLNTIDKLERTNIDIEQFNKYDEHFLLVLLPGLILLILGATLNTWLGKMVI